MTHRARPLRHRRWRLWSGRLLGSALSIALALGPTSSQAAPATAVSKAVEARKACAAGKVERGIELLAEIIAETGDPNAVYNQARCYQQNGQAQPALARFREYLRTARKITPDERREVDRHIRELEAELSRVPAGADGAPAPPEKTPATELASRAAADAGSTDGLAVTGSAPSAGRERPRRLRQVGLIASAVGVAALAGGGFFSLRVQQRQQDIEGQRGPISAEQLRRKLDQGERDESLQWLAYGVGAAALAGGGLLYLLGRVDEGPGLQAAGLQTVIIPGRAGGAALVRGTF